MSQMKQTILAYLNCKEDLISAIDNVYAQEPIRGRIYGWEISYLEWNDETNSLEVECEREVKWCGCHYEPDWLSVSIPETVLEEAEKEPAVFADCIESYLRKKKDEKEAEKKRQKELKDEAARKDAKEAQERHDQKEYERLKAKYE